MMRASFRPFYRFHLNSWTFFILLTTVLAAGCEPGQQENVIQTDIPFRPDARLHLLNPDNSVIATLAVELASGDSARARGLMNRRSLPANGGMLFLDNTERVQTFWMKNTPLPLDLIFISADSQVVNIAKRAMPFSETTISSEMPAQYVLEVRAGFADRHGLNDSTRVRWRTE